MLVHLSRSTPTYFVLVALHAVPDTQCFAECTGVVSLSYHSSAAFIASFTSKASGLCSRNDRLFLYAIDIYNEGVSAQDRITSASI